MNKKHITSLIALLLLVGIGGIVLKLVLSHYTSSHSTCDYPDMAHRGYLKVAVEFSPLSYHIEGDSIGGFDYQLLQMLGSEAQLKVDIYPDASLSKSLDRLDNGTYDIVARQIPITTENKQKYIFSSPLTLNKQVLVQRCDSNGNVVIRNQIDLAGCTLHIAQDAPTRMRIENLAHEIGDTIYIKEMPDYDAEQLIILVATGEIDYAVCDEARASVIATDYDNIDFKTDISFNQFMSWAMRKESTILCDSVNKWLARIKETEAYETLYTRYFGSHNYQKHIVLSKQQESEKVK